MAWSMGSASNNSDLWDRLMTFISTDATLVGLDQQWEILRNAALPLSHPAPARIAFATSPLSNITPDAWPLNLPAESIKIRIAGTINVPTTGNWGFCLRANGSAQVRIGGVTLNQMSANLTNAALALTHSATLTAGVHTFEVDLVTVTGTAGVGLAWRAPGGGAFSIIGPASFADLTLTYGYNNHGTAQSPAHMAMIMGCREAMIKGPGLAEADEIYIGLRETVDENADKRTLSLFYAINYEPSLMTTENLQPGSGGLVYMPLWQSTIPYWFVASGRRIIVLAKVSTTYSSMYAGFFLPYGLPSEYPYPICVGATASDDVRWSDQSFSVSSFWRPTANSGATSGSLRIRQPDGLVGIFRSIWGAANAAPGNVYPFNNGIEYRPSPDLSYALQELALYSTASGGNVWGELDGVMHISGFNNAAENTLTVDGSDYLVAQSSFRTTMTDYAAIRLE